ncbi:hypothetical protein GWI33_008618 [Rhynchophorus ferrugineus]|uniref:Malate dehydrogenase 1B n=1 Tax=Rhynchophorus ferrugineus TaxID=354439 RepID=A0A834IQQ3_RHYFE|nr:hypothetical protein GWI33_008618 [Rhynchophorus ferrugineus]
MVFYIICGHPECIQFAHAIYVAQYLSDHLPNFKFKKNFIPKSKWSEFVLKLNKKNKWYLVKSPIIWKELTNWGSKPYLIGGLGQFWEYCYCYYGLETFISKENLKKLANDNLQYFEEEQNNILNRKFNQEIGIFGCSHNMLEHLIMELSGMPEFINGNGILFKLYDELLDEDKSYKNSKFLDGLIENFEMSGILHKNCVAKAVQKEEDVIYNSDLIIFLEDFSRLEGEQENMFLKRCIERVQGLADSMNIKAKRSVHVIFCNDGPSCLLATLLIEYCASIIPSNIVAVTAYLGLPAINCVSKITNIEVSKISAPPVWGFIGINEFVDVGNIIFKANILCPFNRAITLPEGSTLIQGTIVKEFRMMSYLVSNLHNEIKKTMQRNNECIVKKLHYKPYFAQLRSLMSLIKIWYSEDISDEIISLGVCSNGTFGIPSGVVFSQPAVQDSRHRWVPFQKFPIMNENTIDEINNLVKSTVSILSMVAYEIDFRSYSTEDVEDG